MGRGAPNKPGLSYFPKMLDFYDDDKIFDLMDEYGPLGVTVYDVILTIVYSHGYYVELSKAKLSRMVIRKIGNKWIKGQSVVVQVIDYCAELGLLSKGLLQQNIITSEGIQRRYYEIAVIRMKRLLYSDKYWLLNTGKTEEPLLNAPEKAFTSEGKRITSEENRKTSEEIQQKEKENKKDIYIGFSDPELEQSFQTYLAIRESRYGAITAEQIGLLRDDLKGMSDDIKEQVAIVKKAAASGWKSFYPVKGRPVRKAEGNQLGMHKTKFSNFDERSYDMDDLERRLIDAAWPNKPIEQNRQAEMRGNV